MDSLIRLNQLNLSELSGYIASIFNSLPKQSLSGDLSPSGSGVYSLGSSENYYKDIYVNGISVPYGGGITIGNSFVTAYTSGGAGVIQINDYKITSSGNFISIQGPQGIQGPTGLTGPTGATGISITGASYNNYELTLKFSNGNETQLAIPPLSGATGISVTGFFQSGNFIYPQFDKFRGTGAPVRLIAGPQGERGLPGTVIFYFNSGLNNNAGKFSKVNFPNGVQILDYYDENPFPPISLMRGMSYTFDFSGLNTHTITEEDYNLITGLFNNSNIPNTKIGDDSNYYFDSSNGTGYWRIAFFDSEASTGIYSGLYTDEEDFYNKLSGRNSEIYGDFLYTDTYRTQTTFNTKYTAKNYYKYGFVTYSVGESSEVVLTSGLITDAKSIAIIVGNVYISSGVGPAGKEGPQGPQGIEGPPGTGVGPKGDPGAGISQIIQDEFKIKFLFENNTTSDWILLPEGGPSGAKGPPGSLTNYFRGEYSNAVFYYQNDTVSRNGSTYIYINQNSGINKNPELYSDYWQLLAKSGEKGEIGLKGESGIADKYSSRFFVSSGFPIGINNLNNGITGITVNNINLSGTGAIFKVGDEVSFKNSGIIGYSYTPYQNLIFSSNTISNSYFFGKLNSYNPNNGTINFTVESGGTGIINNTISGGYFLWYNYNNATINLGANLMSGSRGPEGPIGPQGPAGTPSLLRNTGVIYLKSGQSIILNPSGLDVFNITITGDGRPYWGLDNIGIDFNWSYFETGKCVLLKIRNSGVLFGNQDRPLFSFSGESQNNIKWPNNIYTRPDNNEAYIYSILRFIDEDGHPSCFGTYSNPYFY